MSDAKNMREKENERDKRTDRRENSKVRRLYRDSSVSACPVKKGAFEGS